MTPEEKAKELVDKYFDSILKSVNSDLYTSNYYDAAIQCALICAAEIIQSLEAFGYSGAMYDDYQTGRITTTDDRLPEEYWIKVKEEIKKL
jgi:hypothetical protein